MTQRELDRIRRLVGEFAILIPIPLRTKAPRFKGWQAVTLEESQSTAYQRRLTRSGNVGILQGRPSQGLCSIDIDDDHDAEEFLELNPELRDTLRSRGSRGQNVWLYIQGDYPRLTKITRHGKPWGEFRSDGGQTVIAGTHPSGRPYVLLSESSPMSGPFSAIHWPEGITPPAIGATHPHPPVIDSTEYSISLNPSASLHHTESSASLHHTESSASLHHTNEISDSSAPLHPGIAAFQAQRRLETEAPSVARLYSDLIECRYTPRQGERNTCLVAMVTFLYRAVSKDLVLRLANHFYDANVGIWIDHRDQHEREGAAHLRAVAERYPTELSELERSFYAFFNPRQRAAFRITRDLARLKSEGKPDNTFFLSCNQLASRLNCHPQEAHRILSAFQRSGILIEIEKGQRRHSEKTTKATVWGWLLPAGTP